LAGRNSADREFRETSFLHLKWLKDQIPQTLRVFDFRHRFALVVHGFVIAIANHEKQEGRPLRAALPLFDPTRGGVD